MQFVILIVWLFILLAVLQASVYIAVAIFSFIFPLKLKNSQVSKVVLQIIISVIILGVGVNAIAESFSIGLNFWFLIVLLSVTSAYLYGIKINNRQDKPIGFLKGLFVSVVLICLWSIPISYFNNAFQGFSLMMSGAKSKAVQQNHTHAYELIAKSVRQCSKQSNQIKFKSSFGKLIAINCSANNITKGFVNYFNSIGWKNPYDKNKCCRASNTTPKKGVMHIYTMDDTILIKSNTFKGEKDEIIVNTVNF